ncbi:hypothetical protein ABIC83_003061 [Roseateles asaccharophilus]|uniref:hypothetical protein n=1 Tax=Roseateles asaccharophilus TaxID=582607 RepID=UPI0038345A03
MTIHLAMPTGQVGFPTELVSILLHSVAIALILWQAIALHARKQELASLQSDQKLLCELLWEYRDTWDHLPRFVAMTEEWRELSREIGFALPRVEANSRDIFYERHGTPLMDLHWGGGTPKAELAELVRRIDDPKLTELWASGRIIDLVKILRLALFKSWQPGFDLSPLYAEPDQEKNGACRA